MKIFGKYVFFSRQMSKAIRTSNEGKFRKLISSDQFHIEDTVRGREGVIEMLLSNNDAVLFTALCNIRSAEVKTYPNLPKYLNGSIHHTLSNDIIKAIINVIDKDNPNLQSTQLLHEAVEVKNLAIVKALLLKGADMLAKSDENQNVWQCYIKDKDFNQKFQTYKLDDVGTAIQMAFYTKMYDVIYYERGNSEENFKELINLKGFSWVGNLRDGYNIIKHLIISKNFALLDIALEKFTNVQAYNMLMQKGENDGSALNSISDSMPKNTIKKLLGCHGNVGEKLLISAIQHDNTKIVAFLLLQKVQVSQKAKEDIMDICNHEDSELSNEMPKIKLLLEKAGYILPSQALPPQAQQSAIAPTNDAQSETEVEKPFQDWQDLHPELKDVSEIVGVSNETEV